MEISELKQGIKVCEHWAQNSSLVQLWSDLKGMVGEKGKSPKLGSIRGFFFILMDWLMIIFIGTKKTEGS